MESLEKEIPEFQPREYQLEMLELVEKKNIILYLPTGSGKTFIAIMLIKKLAQNTDLSHDILSGGKRTFFLVNTVALVEQQFKTLCIHTPFTIGKYSGEYNVDTWDKETWYYEFNLNQVIVMTAQIFLDLIQSRTISLKNANLIIFDECHRAVAKHPYRQLMQQFKVISGNGQPRILGLTATLLNGNITPANVTKEIRNLELTFMAQIATSSHEALVKLHSTNPIEKRVSYSENVTTSFCYKYRDKCLEVCQSIVSQSQIEEKAEVPVVSMPDNARRIELKKDKTNKRLKNLIEDIKVNMDDLGIFGGSMSVLVHMVQLEQMLPDCVNDISKLMYQCILTQCTLLRKTLLSKMQEHGGSSVEQLNTFSSDKVIHLYYILRKMKPSDTAIIFVKRRFTAKILYYVLDHASKIDPTLSHIKPNFIVGYNIGNPFKDTREGYVQRSQNKKVMNLFNRGEVNTLCASNVVEEGIDITQCNYVIMFDLPQDFRAYVQSKGRARDKSSHYLLMISKGDHGFEQKLEAFRNVENKLQQILCGGKTKYRKAPTEEEINESLFVETEGLEPFFPLGPDGPNVTAYSAISLIYRYFASLKHDKFTKITPVWLEKQENNKFFCYLQLPMESTVRELVQGTWQSTKEDAMRSVALEACKKLYSAGEMDTETCLPRGWENPPIVVSQFTPNYSTSVEPDTQIVNNKTYAVGTKKYKRPLQKEWADCLKQCRPVPDKPCYLHLIQTKPVYNRPTDNNRLQVVYEMYNSDYYYAILTSKNIPQLAPFPLYTNTGELECIIQKGQQISLSQKEIILITDFHAIIFEKLLAVTKGFLIRDNSNGLNSYLLAPVILDKNGELQINWNVVEQSFAPFPLPTVKPTDEDRQQMIISSETYTHKVVAPWYRSVPAQKYLVTKVCTDKNENSPFPNESFATYKEYFEDKYKILPIVKNQPLVEVRAFSSRLNSTVPRALTKQLRRNKHKDENEEFEVWLLPEFCVLYPLPGHYWLKALLLPSVLHRVSQLTMAEQLRVIMNKETGIGTKDLPPGASWQKLKEDESIKKKEKIVQMEQAFTPLSMMSNIPSYSPSKFAGPLEEDEPVDLERNIDDVSVFDLLYYKKYVDQPLQINKEDEDSHQFRELFTPKTTQTPQLDILQMKPGHLGPQQVELMQALTIAATNDFVSCERLETLGDAFLKFAVSLSLFEAYPDLSEGHLTNIKCRIVGNKNLFHCGMKKNLGSIIQAYDFSPSAEWLAPGFCVESSIKDVIQTAKLSPTILYSIEIPAEDVKRGKFSKETHDAIGDILLDAEDMEYPQNSMFINQQAVTDKNVSDAVEAILGTYLKANGIFGALAVLKWFGVTGAEYCSPEIFTKPSMNPARGRGDPGRHLLQPDKLEHILGYKFKNRCYLLEALCHPSYSNTITVPYQRLEFLGDSIVDFLITAHIYEQFSNLSPGDLTDLRSALVNNITLACIVVRHGLHRFLLQHSVQLTKFLQRFVRHQQNRKHVIDDDILFLLEEDNTNISESIEVPKALGDIFESLVGAVYLDSNKDLDVTWKMIYRFMHQEIDKFSHDVPKNHVRMLYESNLCPSFKSSIQPWGAVMVKVDIISNGKAMTFNGFGDNKKQAKRAAAKHALRHLRTSIKQ